MRNKRLVVMLSIALVASGVAVVVITWSGQVQRGVIQTANGRHGSAPGDPLHAADRSNSASTDDPEKPKSFSNVAASEDAGVGNSGRAPLRVMVVDKDSQPIPGISLRYASDNLWDWPPGWEPPPHDLAVTGADGTAYLTSTRDGTVYVASGSDQWQLRAAVRPSSEKPQVLRAREVATLFLSAICDNATEWVGEAVLRAGSASFERRVRFEGTSQVEVKGVPLEPLTLLFEECVIGFDEQSYPIPREDVFHNSKLVFTLRANPANVNGAIEVDLSAYTGRIRELLITLPDSAVVVGGAAYPTGDTWMSRPLPPGSYVVKIVGAAEGDPAWVSEVVLVPERSVAHVAYSYRVSATIELRAVDDLWQPVAEALLLLGDVRYLNFDFVEEQHGTTALGTTDGLLRLGGLKPGRHVLTVSGRGFEPSTIEVELVEGEYKVLPPVMLTRAQGRIEVSLTGREGRTRYSILILAPGGRAIATARDIEDETVSFENLPMAETA